MTYADTEDCCARRERKICRRVQESEREISYTGLDPDCNTALTLRKLFTWFSPFF